MMIIDSQVHAYEANTVKRPWDTIPNWPKQVTGDQMVEAMDSLDIEGAILVSPFSLYGYDASYAVEVRTKHPKRFGLVKPVDPMDPQVGEIITAWKATPGAVGVRIMMTRARISPRQRMGNDRPNFDLVCREARRNDLPVNLLCWDNLEAAFEVIDRHPETRFIVDHLGILQPMTKPFHRNQWAALPRVLELANRQNAVIKVSGVCTLSGEGCPFSDIWEPLARVFDAWGIDRCLWGSDWTRTFALVNYEEAVKPFCKTDRLTKSEVAELMGGACAKAYGWKPDNT